MIIALICTEGLNTEPACIGAFMSAIGNQAPLAGVGSVEVIPVPMRSNHGYKILVEKADEEIEKLKNNQDSILSLADDTTQISKWLVCDYDQLDSSGISAEDFRKKADKAGFKLIMSKPNFEYYVLAALAGWDVADQTPKKNLVSEINLCIDKLNIKNARDKNFSSSQIIPRYSKKKHLTDKFFGMLFSYHKELFLGMQPHHNLSNGRYSDVPILFEDILGLYEE